jgi:hypothetical protein
VEHKFPHFVWYNAISKGGRLVIDFFLAATDSSEADWEQMFWLDEVWLAHPKCSINKLCVKTKHQVDLDI